MIQSSGNGRLSHVILCRLETRHEIVRSRNLIEVLILS